MKKKPAPRQPNDKDGDYWKEKYIKVLEKYTVLLEEKYVKNTIKNRGFSDLSNDVDGLFLN